jgi:hypothetical protein
MPGVMGNSLLDTLEPPNLPVKGGHLSVGSGGFLVAGRYKGSSGLMVFYYSMIVLSPLKILEST